MTFVPTVEWLAKFVRGYSLATRAQMAFPLARALLDADPAFDQAAFLTACGVEGWGERPPNARPA